MKLGVIFFFWRENIEFKESIKIVWVEGYFSGGRRKKSLYS